jgi:SHS family sialic acid transporter-like MFS transporter
MATNAARQPWYKELSGAQIRGFWAAWMGYALDGFDFVIITYVLTNIEQEFHLDLVTASTLISAAFISRWIGGAVVGSIADRIGRKQAMIAGIWLYALGTFLCGFAWNYWSLFAFRLIVGLGMAGEYSASATYVLESWPKRIRNKASGFLLSGYTVGSIVVSLIYPFIVTHWGWRVLFYLGIIPVFVTLYMRANLPESAEWDKAKERGNTTKGISFFQLLSGQWLPVLLTIIFFIFSAFMMNWPIQSLLPTYLKTTGFDPAGVGQIMFLANFGYLLGTLWAGFLGDWVGTRRAYIYTLLISLVLIIPIFWLGHSAILLLGALVFLLEFTSIGISGLHPKYMSEHFSTEVRGAALGVGYNIGALGGAVAPIVGTALASQIGLGNALALLTFFWTLVVIAIVASNLPGRVSRRATAAIAEFSDDAVQADEEHNAQPAG